MFKKTTDIILKLSKKVAPFAMALAVLTANSTCYFFSYQPDVPETLKRHNS